MKKTSALAAFSAAAGPRVEIVEAWQENPGSGIVDFTYEVGDLEDGACNLEIKVGAAGVTPVTITHTNVTSGMVTTNVDVRALLGEIGPNVTFVASLTEVPHSVRLWKGGPCWAECNVGATSPEDVGCYFWWGDTTGYRRKPEGNGWMSVADSSDFRFDAENCPTYGKDLAWLQAAGYVDPSGELLAVRDATTIFRGGLSPRTHGSNLLISCIDVMDKLLEIVNARR